MLVVLHRNLTPPRIPSLPVMARLLAQDEVWDRMDRFHRTVVRRAYRLALLGDKAPTDKQLEYMRYCAHLLNKFYFSDPLGIRSGVAEGALTSLAGK